MGVKQQTAQYDPVTQIIGVPPSSMFDDSINDAAPNPARGSTWRGVKTGLLACAASSLVVFLINLAVTMWSISRPRGVSWGGPGETGRRILFEGSCETSRAYSIGLHLLINVLGSIVLAASNYGMQCLSAPNREEVDKAHAKGEWLDIGILSFRNLRRIARKRAVLWWLLAVLSVPLHLLYNSVIFSSLTNYDYSVYTVDPRLQPDEHLRFLNSDTQKRIEDTWARLRAGQLENLTTTECMLEYATAFQTSRNHVILVSDPGEDWDGEDIFYEEYSRLGSDWLQNCPPDVYEWICPTATCNRPCRSLLPEVLEEPNDWRPFGYKVEYCLSQPTEQFCRLNFSIYLAAGVLIVNALKTVLLAWIAFHPPKEPLFILGDAIQSFINTPDTHTEGSCLASADMIRKGQNWTGPHPLSPQRRRWAAAVSNRRWIFSSVVYGIAIGVSLFFLGWGLTNIVGPRDIASLWNLGFGRVSETALITGLQFLDDDAESDGAALVYNALVSNLPQLIFSMLYFQYNGLFTCMAAAREWSEFGVKRKPLRVSRAPRGRQKSQYFLQLPYHFSIPLLALSILMHWMLSQSIFIVAVETIRDPFPMFWGLLTCGYSPIAIIFVVIASAVMVVGVGITACHRLPSNMPVVGSCSLAIAAACHQPSDRSTTSEMALMPLRWGSMNVGDSNLDHCGFSHEHVEDPQPGVSYS